MALYNIKKVDFSHKDDRGELYQLVHEGYTQINVSTSKKDVIRGGHYHKVSKEAFFVVSGSVEVTLTKDDEKEVIIFKKVDFFEILPFVVHSMKFLEDTTLVAMYDIPVEKENGEKDIYSI